MIIEFVGGPCNGEKHEVRFDENLCLWAPKPRVLTDEEKAAINYREGVYEREGDGDVFVWQGWR